LVPVVVDDPPPVFAGGDDPPPVEEAVFGCGVDDGTFGRHLIGIMPTPALYAMLRSSCRCNASLVGSLANCTKWFTLAIALA